MCGPFFFPQQKAYIGRCSRPCVGSKVRVVSLYAGMNSEFTNSEFTTANSEFAIGHLLHLYQVGHRRQNRSTISRGFPHMAETNDARLVIRCPPSLKAAVGRAARRSLMTASAFARLAVLERLAHEPKPVPRKRDAKATPVEAEQAAVA